MNKEEIIELIQDELQEDFQIAGDDLVDQVVSNILAGNKIEFEQKNSRGNNFDFEYSIKTIAEFATLIKTAIDIYKYISEKNKNNKTSAEIKREVIKEVSKKRNNTKSIDIEKIVERIMGK